MVKWNMIGVTIFTTKWSILTNTNYKTLIWFFFTSDIVYVSDNHCSQKNC